MSPNIHALIAEIKATLDDKDLSPEIKLAFIEKAVKETINKLAVTK